MGSGGAGLPSGGGRRGEEPAGLAGLAGLGQAPGASSGWPLWLGALGMWVHGCSFCGPKLHPGRCCPVANGIDSAGPRVGTDCRGHRPYSVGGGDYSPQGVASLREEAALSLRSNQCCGRVSALAWGRGDPPSDGGRGTNSRPRRTQTEMGGHSSTYESLTLTLGELRHGENSIRKAPRAACCCLWACVAPWPRRATPWATAGTPPLM